MSDEGRLIAGRYRLVEQIGRGGMGTVWRSEDELLGRQVAVKQLHISHHLSDDELATLHERTRREARSAARITHPNVVVVHDVVDHGGLPCIVMEYVPSTTLADVLKDDGTVSPAEAARIGRGMIAALRAAHAAGVLHRDVKPGNVLLGRADEADGPGGGRVVLTDFGIAMATGTSTLTKAGEVVGSIDYIAPERVKGRKPGPASDLWALGATLYQALEGRPPFRRATAMETAYAIAMDPLEPIRNAGPLTGLVEALLAKDPEERPSLEEVERALRRPAAEAETTLLRSPFAPTSPSGSTATTAPAPSAAAAPSVASAASAPGQSPAPTASTAPTVPVPAPPKGGRPRRRTALLSALAVMVVALVAAGGVYLLSRDDDGGTTQSESEGKHSPGPTKDDSTPDSSRHTPPPVPEGYHLQYEQQFDVSVPVPNHWTREVTSSREVKYIDPSGKVGIRFDVLDFASPDPLEHLQQVERQFKAGVKDYYQRRMQRTKFRGQEAAVWEMSWQGAAREWYAIDLCWGRKGEKEYALYLSAPRADWDRYLTVFNQVRDGLALPGDAPRAASGSGQG